RADPPRLFSRLLFGKFDIRRVFLARNILHDRLAALHDSGFGIVGIARRAVQLPALVQRQRHLVAERGIVGGGQETVDFHAFFFRALIRSALARRRPACSAWSFSTMRPARLTTALPAFSGAANAAT